MSICIAVVGAGRMGSVVAGQLPDSTKKIIIDIDPEKASRLAESVGGMPSDSLESANKADLVAVVADLRKQLKRYIDQTSFLTRRLEALGEKVGAVTSMSAKLSFKISSVYRKFCERMLQV